MRLSWKVRGPRRVLRVGVIGLAAALGVIGVAAPAQAHIPVLLNQSDTVFSLEHSPLVPEGTTSFAFYGRTGYPGDTRAMRIQLTAGQQFHAEILIPDLVPEAGLAPWQLPRMMIVDPQHRSRLLPGNERKYFFEPFTQTSYLTLGETTEVAQSGTYDIVVIGVAPARFVAVTGQVEKFTATLKNATVASLDQVQSWYHTPPQATNDAAGVSVLMQGR